ncbi:MAG: RNA 2',3'-cyclic phosphodiesterase, partial [Candidatus Nanohaloarchaea archaeon]
MRVFSAVDIENGELLDELERVRDRLDLGFNTVPGKKMHITLQFFEDLDQAELEKVEEALESIQVEPFTAELAGVGAFPSRDYIRVVWAGAESEKLHDLHAEASRHGIPENNEHEFQPHVTLARVKEVTPGK